MLRTGSADGAELHAQGVGVLLEVVRRVQGMGLLGAAGGRVRGWRAAARLFPRRGRDR